MRFIISVIALAAAVSAQCRPSLRLATVRSRLLLRLPLLPRPSLPQLSLPQLSPPQLNRLPQRHRSLRSLPQPVSLIVSLRHQDSSLTTLQSSTPPFLLLPCLLRSRPQLRAPACPQPALPRPPALPAALPPSLLPPLRPALPAALPPSLLPPPRPLPRRLCLLRPMPVLPTWSPSVALPWPSPPSSPRRTSSLSMDLLSLFSRYSGMHVTPHHSWPFNDHITFRYIFPWYPSWLHQGRLYSKSRSMDCMAGFNCIAILALTADNAPAWGTVNERSD
jgi:hypothetical protein